MAVTNPNPRHSVEPVGMDPELELKEKPRGETEPSTANGKVVPCTGNSNGACFSGEVLAEKEAGVQHTTEDFEVDIVGCSISRDVGQVETKNDETDESLSSFGGTSDAENELMMGDDEVESCIFPDGSATSFRSGYGREFQSRRKRLTDHWRKFIHPLMWRCKWIELKHMELRSQALKTDGDLAEFEQRKELYETFKQEGFEGKSKPFSSSIPRNRNMKRKKRTRHEEMTDAASYMLQNKLLSYQEIKKRANTGAPVHCELPFLDRRVKVDNGSAYQNAWESLNPKRLDSRDEHILMKIEVLHSRVRKLRSRMDVLMSENPGKFSYATTSSDFLACPGNPDSLAENGDGEVKTLGASSHLVLEHQLDDFMLAGVSTPSDGVAVPLPDWPFDDDFSFDIDQDFGPYDQPARDETMQDLDDLGTHDQPARDKTMQDLDDIATHDQRARDKTMQDPDDFGSHDQPARDETKHHLDDFGNWLQEKPESPNGNHATTAPSKPPSQAWIPLLKMNIPGKTIPKSRLRATSIKRKRGKRKPGATGWRSKSLPKK